MTETVGAYQIGFVHGAFLVLDSMKFDIRRMRPNGPLKPFTCGPKEPTPRSYLLEMSNQLLVEKQRLTMEKVNDRDS